MARAAAYFFDDDLFVVSTTESRFLLFLPHRARGRHREGAVLGGGGPALALGAVLGYMERVVGEGRLFRRAVVVLRI